MPAYLRIETCHPEQSAKGLAFLDPEAMESEGFKEGDMIEVLSSYGKGVLARLGAPMAEDRGQGFVRLDQYLRQSIKAFLGDMVEVDKATTQPVQRLVLAPLIDVSDISGLEAYLLQSFAAVGMATSKGAILYTMLPGATAGAAFKVVEMDPGSGLITLDTHLELKYLFSVWPSNQMDITFEDVGGLSKEIRMVRELIELPLRFPDAFRQLGINPPRGIIFHGPPGSGKTYLAKAIANEIKAKFIYINGPEIISSVYGETEANLRKTFEEAAKHLPSIVFIDELDVMAPKRGESGSQTDTRMVTQLLEVMDGLKRVEGVMVIGTTNRIDSLDRSIRRPGRFDREIFIGPPDRAGRLEILRIHTRGMPLAPDATESLEEVAKQTNGFVGADLMELCREAGLNCLRRQIGDNWNSLAHMQISLHELSVGKDDFLQALGRVRPSAMREAIASIPEVSWEDIGGLQEVKDRLRELIEKPLQHPEAFASMGIKPPSGIMLYGPPGTGKTLLAQAIANHCQANFLSVKGPEIFSKWLGESEEGIRQLFRTARQVAPAIIFFDQVDAIAPTRSAGGDTRASERVVNQLLTEMDGIEPMSGITVVAATNRLDLLDPAILRPGRFGAHVFVPEPNEEDRRAIFAVHLRGTVMDESTNTEEVLELLASSTEGFGGAEIAAICHEARLCALRHSNFEFAVPLKLEHFREALEKISVQRLVYTEQQA
ncbi:MAG: AAA family ATPase [Dehalococcoidia bacterium]|nr:AAA family ATPase [Dehalococcoidia bacterium]